MPCLRNIRREFAALLPALYDATASRQDFVCQALSLEDDMNVELADVEEALTVIWYVLDAVAEKQQ